MQTLYSPGYQSARWDFGWAVRRTAPCDDGSHIRWLDSLYEPGKLIAYNI
jgi:hypothetical protein